MSLRRPAFRAARLFSADQAATRWILGGSIACAAALTGCTKAPEEAPQAAAVPVEIATQVEGQQHLSAARELAEKQDFSRAADEYTAALESMRTQSELIQAESLDAQLLFERGVAYLHMGFPDTAAADFTEVLRLRPTDGAAFAKRGEAYAKLGDLYKAVRDCTNAIRYEPECAVAYRYRAESYAARQQFDRAVADYEQAVVIDPALEATLRPQLAAAYQGWGELLAANDQPAESEQKLAQARQLDPTIGAGAAAGSEELSSEAIELTAAKQVVDQARENYEQALSHMALGQYDDALAQLTSALEARSDYSEAYLKRGETLLAQGFPDSAVPDLEAAVNYGNASASDTVLAYRLQAKAFLQLDNPHRAALAATEALHLEPADAASYGYRGTAYAQLESWERAEADLEEAIRRNPALADKLRPALDRVRRQRLQAETSELAQQRAG